MKTPLRVDIACYPCWNESHQVLFLYSSSHHNTEHPF